MSKIILAVLFAVIIIPFSANAQENGTILNKNVQSEVKTVKKQPTLQDLQSKLVDQYGVDGFRFVKSNDAVTKTTKTLSAKELSETSGLDEYTIIIILAAIGAIAVILFIFK